MNQFTRWKGFLVAAVIALGLIYALPNLYKEYPAIQLTANDEDAQMDANSLSEISSFLTDNSVPFNKIKTEKRKAIVLFPSEKDQIDAKSLFDNKFPGNYSVALTSTTATPQFFSDLAMKPITKGLDLRGGVHLLLQVDTSDIIKKNIESNLTEIQTLLSDNNIAYDSLNIDGNNEIVVTLKNADDMSQFENKIYAAQIILERQVDTTNPAKLYLRMSEAQINEVKTNAVEQNTAILRKRMNSIGVAEPSIQREGDDRISVQLPGLSDPNEAKDVMKSTASLEFYIVDEEATRLGKGKFGTKTINDENGRPVILERKMVISGANIIDASSGVDQSSGKSAVYVTLNSDGAAKMLNATHENLKRPMATVYIEHIPEKVVDDNGNVTEKTVKKEVVISTPIIQSTFSKKFQTTGDFTPREAARLARTLKSGALVAPVFIVEERTIGPSAGKKNIEQGMEAIALGFGLVMLFMLVYYKKFGAVAVTALLLNVVLIVAVLSAIGATLTLPGIAGVVLTMGMAVDANVLIFERIREELRQGRSALDAINHGFDNAFSTITDANITTLIAAAILFSFGTGPIKGFAVTLSIGIVTSMFTAIIVSRLILHLWLGKRRNLKSLSI